MEQEFVTLPREVVEQAIEALFCTDSEEGSTSHENELKAVKKLRAALDKPQNHVPDAGNMVPAGWKLVPVEPTQGMIEAGKDAHYEAEKRIQEPGAWKQGGFAKRAVRAAHVFQAMLDAAPQPQALDQPQVEQPAMTPIAQRKLDSLLTEGYKISGYSVYHEQKHQHGFVTGAGLVGWWRPEGMEYPQPQGEQPPVAWALYCADKLHLVGIKRHPLDGFHSDWSFRHLYTHPQPKREPLTDEQIDAIADAMPGGLEGFMKGWGWRQFARAVLEAAPQPPTTEQSSAVVEECLTDELKPRFSAHDDAERLKSVARGMSYNDHGEAIWKHTLMEIAVRLESGGYAAPQPPALEQQVEKESTCKDYLQVEQEPVAWLKTWNSVGNARTGMQRLDLTPECETWLANMFPTITPLYTHPQPKREPLTHYEIHELFRRSWDDCQDGDEIKAFARAIEAAHNIK